MFEQYMQLDVFPLSERAIYFVIYILVRITKKRLLDTGLLTPKGTGKYGIIERKRLYI